MEQTLKQLIFSSSFSAVYVCLNEIAEDMRHDLEKVSLPLAPRTKKPEPIKPPPPEIIQFLEPEVPSNEVPPKTKKDIHHKAIQAKAVELKAKGISANSLLTKESMSEWIGTGKSYWSIAEETGASDAEVSAMAKLYGLQSTLSKIVAGKKSK
jgi:hypothetical protein